MPAIPQKAFHTIRKTRVPESIIEQIQDLIASGRLSPGVRLPSERDLARRFSVGRSAVREAMRAMESMGLVEVRAGDGTFVSQSPSPREAQEAVSEALFHEWNTQRKLFEVRRVLEPDLAALAARRASKAQIERLRAILEEQEGEIQRGGTSIKQDSGFHYALAEATGNEILVRIMDSLMDLLQKTRQESLQNAARRLRSLAQHRAILRAIEARDASAAERRMLEHIMNIEDLVFSQQQTPPPGRSGRAAGSPSGGAA